MFAAYINRASAYYATGDYNRSIADYTEAARLKPSDANVYSGRGLAYYRGGAYQLAVDDFSQRHGRTSARRRSRPSQTPPA